MSSLALAVLFVALGTAKAFAQELPALTLSQALAEAGERNPEIVAAKQNVEVARSSVSGAVPAPLQAQAAQGLQRDVPGGLGSLPTFTAGVSQELSLQTTARRAAARAGVAVALADFAQTQRDVATRVINAYYTLGAASALVKTQQASVVNARQIEDAAKLRQRVGAVGNFEVLRADVEVRRSQSELLRVQANERSARIALNVLLVRSPSTPTTVSLEASALQTIDTEALYRQAERADPQIAALRATIDQARAQQRAAELARAPTLNLAGGYQYQRALTTARTSSGPTANVSLAFPLVDYGSLSATVHEAQARLAVARAQLEARTLQLRAQIEELAADVQSAQARLDLARASLGQAEDGLRIAQFGYERGALSVLDVISARSALGAAQSEMDQSTADLGVATARLSVVLGKAMQE